VGHNLKLLVIIKKMLAGKLFASLRKLFAPPGVPSWLRAWLLLRT